ncbi:MAG TPA: oxidoreductase [Pyrinomonadaceae bacterium]|jgi:predicted dehydrogenase
MTDEISVGLIGYGMAARVFHAPVIQSVPGLRLKKIVERRTDEARKRYPSVEVVRDVSALLQDEEIALVVISTPNSSHFDLARQSLLARKHVVVEKPFTTTSAEAQQLINLARQQQRLISVHQNRRWDGDFQTVKRVLDSKLLGRLVEYESHYDRYRNYPRASAWREEEEPGSGILYDLGSHLIDQALVLFGLPRAVRADIRIQREFATVADNFELVLDYDNLKVSLKAGMLVREQGARFILHGTLGSFVKYGIDPQEEALKRGLTPTAPNWGEEPREMWGTINTEVGGLHVEGQVETIAGRYQTYYQNLFDAIQGRAELAVKAEEARNTVRIIELAQESNERKCVVGFSS